MTPTDPNTPAGNDPPESEAGRQPGESGATPPEAPPSSGESLLIAGALQQARRGSDTPDPPERLPPANTFPGYELVREIHRGGQGVVYLAIQKATKRKVAVKVMHQGPFAGEKDRQRFEREVEILAQLNHANIVSVIDSGSTAPVADAAVQGGSRGSFYCVMEYISGSPLDVWVKERRPPIDEVLRVFVQICDAVNAAHLKGIIHRDLKPANIRVDHEGSPHVLDFGLARVGLGSTTGGDTPELMTMTGQFIGSLPWASPEQAEGAPEKLDLRTDVYSLGVMLYQMLTDRFPYQVVGMMRDVLDNILRAEPARPSTVRRQINNEVETIVLKCLSKERERRYQNAGDLGRDLARYLSGEPIEAKRDSGWYLLTKAARRHKAAFSVAATFLVLLAAFAVAMGVMYRQSERLRAKAEAARADAVGAAEAESAQRRRAESEAAKSDATRRFLESILGAVDPARARGREVRVAEVLADAAGRVESELSEQPDVAAAIRHTIGSTYLGLGMAAEAEPFLQAAYDQRAESLGPDASETLSTLSSLAHALGLQRRYEQSRERYAALIEALDRSAPGDPRRWIARHDFAVLLRNSGRAQDARRQIDAAVAGFREPGSRPEDLGRALITQADLMLGYGSPAAAAEAAPIAEEGVAALADRLGVDHPHTAMMRIFLARMRHFQGRDPEAEILFGDGIGTLSRVLPAAHPDRLKAESWWAEHLHRVGRLTEAEAIYRDIVARWTASVGPEHLETAWARANLGSNLNRQGKWDEAEPELMFALGIHRRELGDASERTRVIAAKIAQMFRESGRPERMRELPGSLR